MRSVAARVYAGTAACGLAGVFLVPGGLALALWEVGIAAVVIVAIVGGVAVYRPATTAPWIWFAVGAVSSSVGVVVARATDVSNPALSSATAPAFFYVATYPALAIGFALLIRDREPVRNVATLVDTATLVTSIGLVAWVYLIRPVMADPTLSHLGRAVTIAYPVGDMMLVCVIARAFFGARGRSPAQLAATAALALVLLGDAGWAIVNLAGLSVEGFLYRLLDAVFLLAFVVLGAAALQASTSNAGGNGPTSPARLSQGRLVLLAVTTLLAPGLLALQVVRGRVTNGLAIAIGSVVLFLLVVVRMAMLLREVERQAIRLRELTRIDELTALPNRRAWTTELPLALERARRTPYPLCVAMIDLDHFKQFNDRFGHPAGDRLLRDAAAAWGGALRDVDLLARYGGEEFIVLLPSADDGDAREILERLRAVTPFDQTFSGGLARWDGVETSDELLDRADQALYRAKAAGRDRVEYDGTRAPGADPHVGPDVGVPAS